MSITGTPSQPSSVTHSDTTTARSEHDFTLVTGVRISNHDGVRISNYDGVRISAKQGVRISNSHGVRISSHDGVRISGVADRSAVALAA